MRCCAGARGRGGPAPPAAAPIPRRFLLGTCTSLPDAVVCGEPPFRGIAFSQVLWRAPRCPDSLPLTVLSFLVQHADIMRILAVHRGRFRPFAAASSHAAFFASAAVPAGLPLHPTRLACAHAAAWAAPRWLAAGADFASRARAPGFAWLGCLACPYARVGFVGLSAPRTTCGPSPNSFRCPRGWLPRLVPCRGHRMVATGHFVVAANRPAEAARTHTPFLCCWRPPRCGACEAPSRCTDCGTGLVADDAARRPGL